MTYNTSNEVNQKEQNWLEQQPKVSQNLLWPSKFSNLIFSCVEMLRISANTSPFAYYVVCVCTELKLTIRQLSIQTPPSIPQIWSFLRNKQTKALPRKKNKVLTLKCFPGFFFFFFFLFPMIYLNRMLKFVDDKVSLYRKFERKSRGCEIVCVGWNIYKIIWKIPRINIYQKLIQNWII